MTESQHLRLVKSPRTPETRFSTVGEVARTMRVSNMTVYRLINTGVLPAYRIGERATRIPTAAVWAYVRGQRIQPGDLSKTKAL